MAFTIVNLGGTEGFERCRSFTVSDAMIVVAGTAFSLALSPFFFHPIRNLIEWLPRLYGAAAAHASYLFGHAPAFWAVIRFPMLQCLWLSCRLVEIVLFGMTLTYLVLRGKRPRPALLELLRQPGLVASLAIVFGLLIVAPYLDHFFFFFKSHESHLARSTGVGTTVAMSWAILALGRWWRAEPGWIDRMGRVLGYAAIVDALTVPLTQV